MHSLGLNDIDDVMGVLGYILLQVKQPGKTVKVLGQIKLEFGPNSIVCSLSEDDRVINEAVKTPINLTNSPNFETQISWRFFHALFSCELPWEMIALHQYKGLFLNIVNDEGHYLWTNKSWEAGYDSDLGLLTWGDGKKTFDGRPLWSTDGLPGLIN